MFFNLADFCAKEDIFPSSISVCVHIVATVYPPRYDASFGNPGGVLAINSFLRPFQ